MLQKDRGTPQSSSRVGLPLSSALGPVDAIVASRRALLISQPARRRHCEV
jgi:hypothetical protein